MRAPWIEALLLAAAIACGGSKEPSKEGDKGGAPPPAPSGGYETSWTGYVSKTFPGTLDDDVEGVKSALRALGLEITEESGGLFEKNLSAVGGDGTSQVVTVQELR